MFLYFSFALLCDCSRSLQIMDGDICWFCFAHICQSVSQTTWICPSCCKKVKVTRLKKDDDNVTFIQTLYTPTEKYKSIMSLCDNEFNIILLPTGWLGCAIIHEAKVLLTNINKNIGGFQRPTLCPVGQFDIVTSDFVQVLHVNNNHWVCVHSINHAPGYVNLIDSLSNSVLSQEIVDLVKNSLSPSCKGINQLPIQQQLNISDCGVFAKAFANVLCMD